jgi:hypothetical protein
MLNFSECGRTSVLFACGLVSISGVLGPARESWLLSFQELCEPVVKIAIIKN